MISNILKKYRAIRIQVFEKATAPLIPDNARHEENKRKFKSLVLSICRNADLSQYKSASQTAKVRLWHHLWTKIRYAGIRSQTATTEISHISELFDNYPWFSDRGWDISSKGTKIQSAGPHARSFLNRTGNFSGKQTIGNVPKLKKTVIMARAFSQYFHENPNKGAIDFVTRGTPADDVWAIHDQLISMGYKGDLTTLHFLMDVGFQVIKPDVVISRLFLDWGWLHHAIPGLPSNLSRDDLIGKGKHGTKFLYFKPPIYKPIIALTKEILSRLDRTDLENDIGWVTNNPIREFDIFMVKAGQMPEQEFGIERRLYE